MQRARRDWAHSDTWDLDDYLAGVIAGSLRHLASITNSWPGPETQWPAPEDWEEALRSLADRFDRMRESKQANTIVEADVDETFAVLRQRWFELWELELRPVSFDARAPTMWSRAFPTRRPMCRRRGGACWA